MASNDANLNLSLAGRQLGDYRMLRRLGRGGMSVVYLAEQMSLKRRVAIKVLKSDLAEDESYVRRFHKEAQAAAALVHANIVQIHEVGQTDGVHFIAQEYVPGQNLRQYMQAQGVVDMQMGLSVLRQVAAALHKAGQSGIIHRDIKPENIMLSPIGEVKVADFGLARVADSGDSMDATQVGMTMGTPLYMSPEQAEGGQIDPRSDLYSLGVTAYHMFSGRTPFEGDNALSIAVQHLKKDPVHILDLRSDLPDDIAALIHQLLSKEPDSRYQSAAELIDHLRKIDIGNVDDHWVPNIELGDASLSEYPDGRMEITQQLSTLMKTTQGASKLLNGRWIVALVLMFAVGAAFGTSYTPPSLLDDADVGVANEIEMKSTVKDQFTFAALINTQEALLSVKRYFPPGESSTNQHYALLVDRHLANLYQQQDQLEKANRIYIRLSNLDGDDIELRAFGLCGQANIAQARGESDEVASILSKLGGLVRQLEATVQSRAIQTLKTELRDKLNAILATISTDEE
ncbi:MAG: serine/threonine-protein kinase [Pirellulaceae bacterium]